MSENIKKVDDKNIEEVAGGRGKNYQILKQDVLAMIPEDLKDKLNLAKSDMEACKILAEHGVDLAKIEKKIADAGFNQLKIGLQLKDDSLADINGGFKEDNRYDVVCECGNGNEDDFSRQFWASLVSNRFRSIYRCKKCNNYIGVLYSGYKVHFSEDKLMEELGF